MFSSKYFKLKPELAEAYKDNPEINMDAIYTVMGITAHLDKELKQIITIVVGVSSLNGLVYHAPSVEVQMLTREEENDFRLHSRIGSLEDVVRILENIEVDTDTIKDASV